MLIKQFVIDSSKKKNQRILRGAQEIFSLKAHPKKRGKKNNTHFLILYLRQIKKTLLDIFIAHVDNEEWKKFILFEHRN